MGLLRASMAPPTLASATTVMTGRPTAVIRKPSAAIQTWGPDCKPTIGGKMMLPAPTNRAKVIKPSARMSWPFNTFISGNTTLLNRNLERDFPWGEGNAVDPYGVDPFSARRPCGQRTQRGGHPNKLRCKAHYLRAIMSYKRHFRVAFSYEIQKAQRPPEGGLCR